jgi:AraC-like DNA-binding protein
MMGVVSKRLGGSETMGKAAARESVEFRRVSELGDLEVVRAAYFRQHFPRHSHDVFAFGTIERGVQATDYRGATHVAVAGDVCLVNPGEAHTGYAPDEEGWSYRCCYPDPALVSGIARMGHDKNSALPYFPSPVLRDPVVYDRFYRLFDAIEDFEDTLGLQEKLIAAISTAVSRHAAQNAPSAIHNGATVHVRLVCDYIEEHWSDQLRLEDIAAAAGMDSYCLIRTFRRHMGMTPHTYLLQRRIEKGKKLLLSGLSSAQVALDSGFFDQSHFTKQFKRFTGATPSNYVRAVNRRQRGGS